MTARTALVLLAVPLATACIGEGFGLGSGATVDLPPPTAPATAAFHCDAIADMSTCVEYADEPAADADCNSYGGSVAEGACPTEARTGSCVHDGKRRLYYSAGAMPSDAAYAEKHCRNAMAGEFEP